MARTDLKFEYLIDRGSLKEKKLNDIQGALADYDQAISLGYKSAHAYRDVLTFLIENNLK